MSYACMVPGLSKALLAADNSPGQLDVLRAQCLQLTASLTRQYLWQRDAFNLAAAPTASAATQPFLQGTLCFGENNEDEWFTVWLLQQITSQISGTAARIWDEDGEFLLIEAAHVLPRWLQPNTSPERCTCIYQPVHTNSAAGT